MKKIIKAAGIVFFLLFAAGTFHGCVGSPSPEPAGRAVVKITVAFENGPLKAYREYTAPEKMQQLLNYLRSVDPYGTPKEDPETAAGNEYRIALVYPDGQEKIYRQKCDRFMQIQGGSWQEIDPQRAQKLAQILGQLKSDPMQFSPNPCG